jgi:hypothetical protein
MNSELLLKYIREEFLKSKKVKEIKIETFNQKIFIKILPTDTSGKSIYELLKIEQNLRKIVPDLFCEIL